MLRQWILTASVLTGAALALRLLFRRRISQRLQYALWLPVLLRLLLPFALYSAPVSVPAAAERVAPVVFTTPAPRQETVLPTAYPASPPVVSAAPRGEDLQPWPVITPAPAAPAARNLDWPRILRFVWLDGSVVLALWLLGVNLGFYNKLRKTRTLFRAGKLPVYVSEAAASPCLFGLFRPAVYLTPEAAKLQPEQLEQVLLHERTHLRQGDQIWGLLRCLCLAVWWWNPLVWLAAACSRRDGELSCDEKVLRTLGEDKRLDYGHTLVDLLPRKTPGALLCTATISGGGKAMKERLERIVKKPRVWIAAAGLVLALTAAAVVLSFAGKGEAAGPEPEITSAPTATAEPEKTWQEQYRDLLRRLLEDETLYEPIGGGPVLSFELLDLSGNGIPELVLYFHGAEQTHAAAVVTLEEGELRCMNRELTLGLPPAENAVDRLFIANPGVYESEVGRNAFFRYYCQTDDGDGRIGEGFYLLDSASGVECESWGDWILFGHDERGYLRCETRLSWELHCDLESFAEVYWEIDGEETSAEEYHAAMDAFDAWLGQYRCLTETGECCVVFHDESDPLAAIDRALAAWTPLPTAVPASGDMGRDRFPLPQGAAWLTEEELGQWENWFAADWMRGQFLTSLYEKPEDVDLHELFYIGVDTEEETGAEFFEKDRNPITPEDKRNYLLHLGGWITECPTDKLPREQIDAVLRKYLGLSLEETNRIRLSYTYLPETDCYYHAHGDTNYFGIPDFLYGYAQGDEVALFYWGNRRVVLRRDGEKIRFVSHLEVLTGRNGEIARTPEVGPSIPANETGDYGRDVTRLQRQPLEAAPEALETWEYPGYGTLNYAGEMEYVCLWFETVDGERWSLPTPQTAAGKLPMVRTGDGYTEGKGFALVTGADRDLITWSMQCPEDTILGGNTVRQGGFALWTLYLPTMETFVYFHPGEEQEAESTRAGSPEWLERYLGGEVLSLTLIPSLRPDDPGSTLSVGGDLCRSYLAACAWLPYDGPALGPEGEYYLVLRGEKGTLSLTQGWTTAILETEGEKLVYRVFTDPENQEGSPADLLRRQVFDPAESNAATSAIRVDASEENPALAYVLKLCEAMKDLSPGSSWGIRDYEVRGVASEEHAEQKELAIHTIVYLLPNVWNSVPWWAGAGMEPAAGDYEGWLIMDVYYLLELEDGAWRYKDSAQYNPGWGSLELDLDHVPEPDPTPEPTQEPTPAPTPEPSAFEPVTLEMWTDWLTLPEGARWLTREELDVWTAWFNADWMRWSFLTSAYARPQDVDLGALFYSGVDIRGIGAPDAYHNPVTAEDMRTYLLHRGELELPIDLDKLPRAEMDALLRKYLGLGLEETSKVGLWFPYFPETDAYYHLHGDTNWGPFPLRYGYVLGDEVCLFNLSTGNHGQFSATGYNNGGEGIYRTVLRTEGDSVHFVSNLRAFTNGAEAAYDVPWQNDAYPDGYAEERDVTVLPLQPYEVFESAGAARAFVGSLGFKVTSDPGTEMETTEQISDIEILLEWEYPGYGTLVYGEIPTGTMSGNIAHLFFITADGRLYHLPLPGYFNGPFRLEREGTRYSAYDGTGFRLQDDYKGSGMVRWWMRLTGLTTWEGLEAEPDSQGLSSGEVQWTLFLPTMEVFILYTP